MKFQRAGVAFAHDVTMAAVSFLLALALRLGPDRTLGYLKQPEIWSALALFTGVCAAVFWGTGLYRGIWRYASTQDVLAIVRAVSIAVLLFLAVTFLVTRLETVPRSVLVIEWLLLVVMLAGPRIAYRLWKDRGFTHVFEHGTPYRVPVLLVGAGDAADLFIRDTTRDSASAYKVLGIVDDKGTRVGRNIRGVPVMDDLEGLDRVVASLRRRGQRPQRLIVTRPLARDQMQLLLAHADAHGIILARLPRLIDFKEGTGLDRPESEDGRRSQRPLEPRPVSVDDLLRRPQARLDRTAMAELIGERTVLITGAGGTIGAELARQVVRHAPRRLVLLDRSEYMLFSIDLDLQERAPEIERRAVLTDVQQRALLACVFDEERPDLVLHAAAVKHVPLAEQSPHETVLTNVVGARNVADLAGAYGARAMVQISTDKAVDPCCVMGATKRLAERYVQARDLAAHGHGTRFVTVRFGNVLGSSGSAVELFERQIARGGPITVTHPEVTRYFMTAREAVQLVLQATHLSLSTTQRPHDVGTVYVLDMGEPIGIGDLARQMVRLAGLRPDKDVAIHYIGLRPGERLHERLFETGETVVAAGEGLHLASGPTTNLAVLQKALDELARSAAFGDHAETLQHLRRLVPNYRTDAESDDRVGAPKRPLG